MERAALRVLLLLSVGSLWAFAATPIVGQTPDPARRTVPLAPAE